MTPMRKIRQNELKFCAGLAALLILCGSFVTACSDNPSDITSEEDTVPSGTLGEDIMVGVVYPGNSDDDTEPAYVHCLALSDAMEDLELDTDTNLRICDDISPDDTVGLQEAVEELAVRGCDIIYFLDPGYMYTVAYAAEEYPDIIFCQADGFFSNNANLINYSMKAYQVMYLEGIVAGRRSLESEDNVIWYVGEEDPWNPGHYSCINAFALGVLSVNPDAGIRTVSSADSVNGDNAYAAIAAADGSSDEDITVPSYDWESFYTLSLSTAMNGSSALGFASDMGGNYYCGLEEGVLDTADLSDDSDVTNTTVDLARSLMLSGEWDVFSGTALVFTEDGGEVLFERLPRALKDKYGNDIVEAGGPSLRDAVIRGYMDYYLYVLNN